MNRVRTCVAAATWSLTAAMTLAIGIGTLAAAEEKPALNFQLQRHVKDDQGQWRIAREMARWHPEETAVVICDMWDSHHCKHSARRVGEMAPRMNDLVNELRKRGCFVIHCPSDTMGFYKDYPGRKLAQSATPVKTEIPLQRWCHLDKDREGGLPIDDSDGGCDTPDEEQKQWLADLKAQGLNPSRPWTRQIKAIEIRDSDAITDSAEAYYLMRQMGIKNVMVMGVHTNMCVLGRPFSIRQMVYQGQNVVLVRDMTDAMYNPAKRPFVNHFRGKELVVEHIERHWCPTTTSAEFLGGQPFVFPRDKRPHVVFVIGEREYDTSRTLVQFAETELPDYRCTFVFADEKSPNDFPGLEALETADLLVLSVRRRTPVDRQLKQIRAYLDKGGPLVAIRTSSHAFSLRSGEPPKGHGDWPEFDAQVLGGNYHNHHGNKLKTIVWRESPKSNAHPILAGVPDGEFSVGSSLYKTSPIADSATLLMTGRVAGVEQHEPVAWTNQYKGSRVFYTSLGGPEDFKLPAFRKMLQNAVGWTLE